MKILRRDKLFALKVDTSNALTDKSQMRLGPVREKRKGSLVGLTVSLKTGACARCSRA